ncbi:16S rRNA (adenine(1518)-N(6)/adenine(1519)-N(6))-dimethyltransferase RsmA [Candidatus Palibaumannia cicadellinicola]|uniref:Ribosomal RNA small subunit methyltransferase A n=1 Tax=Candidatus Palibaumannia cicadellinicola TaxID=186490 RepID=A0A0K2BLN0_9GAMM|nr:16S rRNA (adenine(1518)-N(6)/adenine(1519)-N(6))-dimethyltransferase RsmA [Candidatus Baumannia cicadellinicola]AKZ66092.1 Dimethyladenosine transferase [Candidatus Baumannia cicadellinicola]
MHNTCYQGHVAQQCFGQYFLKDKKIIKLIVDAIDPKKGQALVEIGPGLGALTYQVAKYVDTMTVIEIDRNLADILASNNVIKHKLNILNKDVRKVQFTELSQYLGHPLRIFGNLPYNIATSLIFLLFSYINIISDMHFMLQKEVANRLIAKPNNKAYCRLSVIAQYYCNIHIMLDVPPNSFYPIPKVNSAIVRLVPYAKLPYKVNDINQLYNLTRLAFNQRRKMICNSLGSVFSVVQLLQNGIIATQRAENLSVEQYCRLAQLLS